MFKRLLSLLIAALLALSVLPLTAFAAGPVTVTLITFDQFNPMYTYDVLRGDPFYPPDSVLILDEGYALAGWYYDFECTERFSDGTPVYSEITLYPHIVSEEEIVYVNYYLSADDDTPTESVVYAVGDIPLRPADPDREEENMAFMGWYYDDTFSKEYQFNSPLKENQDLYARFVDLDDILYLAVYLDPEDESPAGFNMFERGEAPGEPAEPGREDEVFMGWYADRELTIPFDFCEPLYHDAEVFPRFVSADQIVNVRFFMGPEEDYPCEEQSVVKGDCADKPVDPSRDDESVFSGWYTDRALENKYDFSQPVNGDLDLYARFVSFDDCYAVWLYLSADADEPVSGIDVAKGEPYPRFGAPGKDGYDFVGWYTDRALTVPADFTSPCYEDVSLFPKFVEAHVHSLTDYDEVPATAASDGCKAHSVCESCGKIFVDGESGLIEVTDPAELIIPAFGVYYIGDVNGSGAVDNRDAVILDRYIAGWDGYDKYIKIRDAADLNRDSKINNRDAMILDRYIAGWDGYGKYILPISIPQ